jgi:hypothetical protein
MARLTDAAAAETCTADISQTKGRFVAGGCVLWVAAQAGEKACGETHPCHTTTKAGTEKFSDD